MPGRRQRGLDGRGMGQKVAMKSAFNENQEKPKIKIRPENRGKFTDTCKNWGYNGVTNECIARGKRSKSPATKKRATFAGNARRWN